MDPTVTAQPAVETATNTGGHVAVGNFFSSPSHWPAQVDLLHWAQNMRPGEAALLLIVGVVYLLFGIYAFKALVTLNAAFVGAYIGYMIGDHNGAEFVGAIVGGITAAAVTWPTMKYAVAIMGGIFGALLGASLWRVLNLPTDLAWAGAFFGLFALGMLSFVLFRHSVMMYTSLQGSVMLIFGILGLIYKYQSVNASLSAHMGKKPFLLPLAIFIPAMLGMIYQQHSYPAAEAPKKK